MRVPVQVEAAPAPAPAPAPSDAMLVSPLCPEVERGAAAAAVSRAGRCRPGMAGTEGNGDLMVSDMIPAASAPAPVMQTPPVGGPPSDAPRSSPYSPTKVELAQALEVSGAALRWL
jgi:hypothetical protein